MNAPLLDNLRSLKERATGVIVDVIGPAAEAVDASGTWPSAGMSALASSGLTGLTAPISVGGIGQGLLGLATLTEMIGGACASTAMCFGMHCVATAVIAAKATRFHEDKYLAPIARGEHLTTLALSEPGTGSHFFMPQTALVREGGDYVVNGEKRFVTNGPHADSFVLSTLASSDSADGEFSCIAVDRGTPGVTWSEAWHGFGMRGNDSRGVLLNDVRVPARHLLGQEGDQVWFVFEVVAPYFLTAMAGTYLGVAQAALDITVQHMKSRHFTHSGQSLADVEVLQHRVGNLWMNIEKSRLLLHHAARLGDLGSPDALLPVLAAKADAANVAVATTNEALTMCGGSAYRDNGTLTRLLRDARASHVMSPTTDMLTAWTGRGVLGLALF